ALPIFLAYTGSVQSQRLQQFGLVPATTGAAIILTASWAMPMTAGDTVQIQPFADGTGNYVIAGVALSSSAFNTSSTFSGWRIALVRVKRSVRFGRFLGNLKKGNCIAEVRQGQKSVIKPKL